MDSVDVHRSPARDERRTRSAGTGWWVAAIAGAAAFWLANLVISLTPAAAAYRSALSIRYVPMLIEAAVGGVVIAGAVAFLLTRFAGRFPGGGIVGKALLLALGALALLTVLLEVPAKLRSDVPDAGHWLLVATVFNTIRILALGVSIGLVTRSRTTRRDRHRLVTGREAQS
jgi:hypothetical protein